MIRRQALATAVSAVFIFPLVFLVLGALRMPGAPPPTGLDVLVPQFTGAGFERAFELVDLGRQLVNSGIVALFAVPLSVLVASWAGFGATCLSTRGRRLVVGASLVALLVPLSALWVPRFVLFSRLDLVDTYVPLVAPALMATSPLYVLLFFWSFSRLPRDLIDAARLEGMGLFAIWRRVAAPLARPTTFAVGALAFVFHWSNFVDPLLYLNDPSLYTAPLGLRQLKDLGPTDFPTLLAASLVVTLPAALAFGAVQHRFLSDLRATGWLGR
ncbi:MAG TPA: carbohydrate ABC transporter permease [Solirubrobacteraceae bacterium]|nr:carbohydrate ABC transporter permease [Solirubrobacteraceae bacterium]